MEQTTRDQRRKIFRKELFTLMEKGYLSESIVETVVEADNLYHIDLQEIEARQLPEVKLESENLGLPKKQSKVKKTLTPEEIRERNITWSLNIGVIFLLIGGLFVATSNWDTMTAIMKSASIAVVSLVFFGIAFLTYKFLQIKKTAFSFLVLGSLFLPIFILSLGWFGLLGPYMSIYGGGRYLLGVVGSWIPAIVYICIAYKLNSRLFVWFSYVFASAGFAFLLAGLPINIDFFYLGLTLFNATLIFLYHKWKNWSRLQLFVNEFVVFIQVNLVLSTIFLLFFFDHPAVYGMNILLTAIIYLSMMYVSGTRHYHFVFSIMIVYGAYQLVEHSFLDYFGEIVYALIGFGMVLVPKRLDERFSLDKIFQYTSAVISGFAFIYITLEGILLRSEHHSVILMIAYWIIAINFIYLTHNSSILLFSYLSSVFAATGIYEALTMITDAHVSLILFFSGFLLFIVFGVIKWSKYTLVIQNSSKDTGLAVMALAILNTLALFMWWELGVMLLALALISFLEWKFETRKPFTQAAIWALPITFGLSFTAFGEQINAYNLEYSLYYGSAVHFAVAAFLLLGSSFVWKKTGEIKLAETSLYTSVAFYGISILYALTGPINQLWVQPLILSMGIGMLYYFYRKVGAKWISYLVSVETLLAYFSIMHSLFVTCAIHVAIKALMVTGSAILLLIIAFGLRRNDNDLSHEFAWVGHCIYPLALIITWFVYHADSIYSFILAVFIYGYCAKLASVEWKIKSFLYGSFTTLFFSILTGFDFFIEEYGGYYEFPIVSVLLLGFSYLTNDEFKKRTTYYLVPFSIFGILCMLWTYPFHWQTYLVLCTYVLMTCFYMHKIKWDQWGIIPLFIMFMATMEFSFLEELAPFSKILLSGGIGVGMVALGQFLYAQIFEVGTKQRTFKLDAYTLISFLYFGSLYFFVQPYLWLRTLPGLFIAITFLLQSKRVPQQLSVFMPILGGIYLLQPYYVLIELLNIPPLWQREVLVLPFIVVVIFIRKMLKGRYNGFTKRLQWSVLLIVSLLLIQDGLASNTIYDAIIIGSLSLLSMIAGMTLQIKSYFFTGAGVLLLNVFLQTRPYWGNMPWWIYLLIAGFILILIASLNEWNKQKVQKGETTFIMLFKEKVINRIKKWE
ncbi:hypothetical protein [Neobacillus sp. LXY-1]|uniref:hypothetical protein n=1 Tax=Neobacillus sp. LXY-1 TaxID=3379133 RepID=UPI003EE108C5